MTKRQKQSLQLSPQVVDPNSLGDRIVADMVMNQVKTKLVEKGGGKLSQLRLAANFVEQIADHFQDGDFEREDGDPKRGVYELRNRLAAVLDKAQNSPPEGMSDGTIDEIEFGKLREVERAAQSLIWAVDRWRMGR